MSVPARLPVAVTGRELVRQEPSVRLPVAYAPPPAQDFTDVLRKLWRRKWLIVGVTLLVAILVAFIATRMEPRYTAAARVLIGVPETRVVNIESVMAGISADAETVQNESHVLKSRELAELVVDRLGLQNDPEFNPALRPERGWVRYLDPRTLIRSVLAMFRTEEPAAPPLTEEQAAELSRQRVVNNLLSKIDVVPLGRSHVLSVEVEAANPATAAEVANALASTYIDHQLVRKVEATRRANEWLNQQIGELREEVAAAEQAVEQYRQQTGLYQSETATVTSQQLTELNTQLVLAETMNAEAQARLGQAQSLLASPEASGTAPEVLNSPVIQSLKGQLAAARARQAEMASTYGQMHPSMVNVRSEIADIENQLRAEIGRVIESLRNEARVANARYQALRSNFERIKGEMGVANEGSIQLRALEREAEAARELLQEMLARSKETAAQQDVQQPDARVISRAAIPEAPSFPPTTLLLLLGAFGGGILGLLLALLVEHFDKTLRSAEDVEAFTGLPTLAMVPMLRGRDLSSMHVLRKPNSPYSEALRKLHAALLFSDPVEMPKVVMFSSAAPSEGKSGICVSMARLLASTGRRVVVVDCDWRRPHLHRLFGLRNPPGLAELLSGEETPDKLVHRDVASGAHVIFAGRPRPEHRSFLSSDRMRMLLHSLAQDYDLVIVDTPPVLVGADALHLAQMVDKTVFVVRWGHTHRQVALAGLKQMLEVQGKVAGVVLSRVDPRRYRRYGYGNLNYHYTRPGIVRAG